MRNARHHARHSDEEDESAFISMTDMTVSILFIVLILLAFFASQLRPDQTVPVSEHELVIEQLEEREVQLQETLSAIEDLTAGTIDVATLLQLREEVVRLKSELSKLQALAEQSEDQEQEISGLKVELQTAHKQLNLIEVNPLQKYNSAVAEDRVNLLTSLRDQIALEFPELGVRLSAGKDALQFQGEGLFASGSSNLSAGSQTKIERIAELIHAILPCYTLGQQSAHNEQCNPSFAIVEALQIEGHTDSDGSATGNVDLSSKRAATTYGAMISHQPDLNIHQNLTKQPVLSVAGYGEDRPVMQNDSPAGKSANRRIDLRFIMLRPASVENIEQIKKGLQRRDAP
ncbi:OmpA family protein [Pacificibacter sp. AS14]|uniref:OmpA family protein n=1 Tax=Alphaproteobacteria TaxID=28211 RepID=UPI00317A597F